MTVADEVQPLRRCIRELAALSTLSAAWSKSSSREVAVGLAGVLCRAVPVSFAFVQVDDGISNGPIRAAHTTLGPASEDEVRRIADDLEPFLKEDFPPESPRIENPLGSGALNLAILPIGCAEGYGCVVAGSPDPTFPMEHDRLLISVAANQAAVVLQRHQADEALRKSERELADFFENATIGLHCVGPDGTILRANQAELNLLGYAPDDYVGHHISEFHADKDVVDCILDRLQSGAELREYEARMRCKDGSIKHVLINSNVLWEDGRFVHTRCFTRDVTDQKAAEEALKTSEERYRRLVGLLPVAVYTCEAPSGKITFYNEQATVFWGRTPKLGSTDERFCGSFKLWLPDGSFLPHQETPMARAIREGSPFRNEEVVIERPDGSRITVLVNIDPVLDEEGKVVGAVNVFHDTTALKLAEVALRESERHLRDMIDGLPAAVYTTDRDGRLTHFNPACIELSGRVPEIGTDRWCVSWKLYHPDGTPMPHEDCPMALALREGRAVRGVEAIAERPDGSRIWFAPYPTPMRDSDGNVVGGINMLVDITETKRAEETNRFLANASAALAELRDCESTMERVAGLAVPFFADWCAVDLLDESGVLRRTAVKHSDESKVELARELYRLYPPREDEPRGAMRVFRSGQSDWEPAITDEMIAGAARSEEHLRIVRELGLRSYICVPLRVAGKTLGVFTFVTAESLRNFTEQDLRVAEDLADRAAIAIDNARLYDRLRLLWEAASVLLTAHNPDAMLQELFSHLRVHLGLDTYFNYMVDESGAALRLESSVGIAEKTARSIRRLEFGQAICGTVAQNREPMYVPYIQESSDPKAELVKSLGIRAYVCNPLISDDHLLGTLSFASHSRDRFEADEIAFLETICRYVTVAYERLRLLEQLQEADRRKDEFLATLAHELRNPLAPVRNAVQLLRLKGPNEPELNWGRDVIDRQISHLTRLIDDLLDISRITRNKLELRKERVELAEVIRGAVETSRPLIEQCGHELTVTLPTEPVYLSADLVRLAQVFMNLLTNAAKYTDRGGHIWLTAEVDSDASEGSHVIVRVKDNGDGIPREKLPRLFEMFFQVDRSVERSQGGLGIGLSLVRRLVELHNGRIEASSDGPGRGSEFTVRLPALGRPVKAHLQVDAEVGRGGNGMTRRILVVDDNRDAADTLASVLKLMGHLTWTAYDGREALEAAARHEPEVIFLDIGLPKVDGCEAARQIRQWKWGKDTVLVALSGWGQEEDRQRAINAGFNHHLTKPVDISSVESLLGAAPASKQ